MTTPPVMLRGVDRAAFAVALATRLRRCGLPVGVTAVEGFVRALAVAPPVRRGALYRTARVSLVRRKSDLPVFDAVFAAVFDDAVLELDPNARRTPLPQPARDGEELVSLPIADADEADGNGLPWATLPPAVAEAEDSATATTFPERLPSEVVALVDVPFEQLSELEMTVLGAWLQSAVGTWPVRRSRRFAIDRRGHRLAIRPTIARSRRTGWEPIQLVHVRAVERRRRVVMLCDVSQSMQAQASAYFHLMRALTTTVDAEVFAFATTLTRLTAVLAHRSADVAVQQATAQVVDRFGGTRIATNLTALLASRHGGTLRGAIVIVASDGWDSDPPDQLAAAMARLRRRAHRVVWINPRAGAPGFEPRVATMAAALPYCDALLPADTFRSLERVIRALGLPPVSSRGSRGSRAGTARR